MYCCVLYFSYCLFCFVFVFSILLHLILLNYKFVWNTLKNSAVKYKKLQTTPNWVDSWISFWLTKLTNITFHAKKFIGIRFCIQVLNLSSPLLQHLWFTKLNALRQQYRIWYVQEKCFTVKYQDFINQVHNCFWKLLVYFWKYYIKIITLA